MKRLQMVLVATTADCRWEKRGNILRTGFDYVQEPKLMGARFARLAKKRGYYFAVLKKWPEKRLLVNCTRLGLQVDSITRGSGERSVLVPGSWSLEWKKKKKVRNFREGGV